MATNEFKYEIINELGVISGESSGWRKEVNRISWNGGEPKYDIRQWGPNHEKMGKGISLSEEEIRELAKILNEEVKFLDSDK